MNLKTWQIWFKEKPAIFKWFLILILLRPVIDTFEELKDQFLFSPAQIIGVLTLALIIISILLVKNKKLFFNTAEKIFLAFGILLLLNGFLLLKNDLSLYHAGNAIKLSFPLYIYIYLKYFIKTSGDIKGIAFTILLSALFPLLMIFYEILAGPIVIYYEPGRTVLRYLGLYPDAVNYSIYFLLTFLITGYFYLSDEKKVFTSYFFIVSAAAVFLLLALSYLSHYTTYVIFLTLVIHFLIFLFNKNKKHALIFLIIFSTAAVIQYAGKIDEKIYPLFKHDVEIIKGERIPEHGFNSRFGIWERHLNNFTDLTFYAQLFGSGFGNKNLSGIGASAHNDFIRILLASGITGLLLYILFLSLSIKSAFKFNFPEKYLILGTFIILLLYSISLTPTFYYPLMYFILAVLVFLNNAVGAKKH